MSQYSDITKTILSKGIRYGLSATQLHTLLVEVLNAVEYDGDFIPKFEEIPTLMQGHLLSQSDGIYGVSHEEINSWIIRENLKK